MCKTKLWYFNDVEYSNDFNIVTTIGNAIRITLCTHVSVWRYQSSDSWLCLVIFLCDFCPHLADSTIEDNANFRPNAIFWLPDWKNCRHKSSVGWLISQPDACENSYRNQWELKKSHSQIWRSHTCVHSLRVSSVSQLSVTFCNNCCHINTF